MNDIVHAADTEQRLGCDELGRNIVIGENIQLCCPKSPKDPNYFKLPYDTVTQGLEKWKQRTEELLAMHRRGIAGPCQGCGNLREGSFPTKYKDVYVAICAGFEGDICNLKCSYCTSHLVISRQEYSKDLKELVKQLTEIYKDSSLAIRFANGEFLIRKDADDILEYLASKNVRVFLTTNASIYRESFEKLIHLGKAGSISVSPDAGTRETYKKIKGYDLFDKVVNNLEKYSEKRVVIDLKYLILPGINDNYTDFVGFIHLATCLKSVRVEISSNMDNRAARLPEYTLEYAVELHNMANKCGLPVSFKFECFNAEDVLSIKSAISQEKEKKFST